MMMHRCPYCYHKCSCEPGQKDELLCEHICGDLDLPPDYDAMLDDETD